MNGSDIMENINNTEYLDAIEMFNCQLMDLYIKQKDYDSAKMIAEKYPDNDLIQSLLITLCIKTGRYENGIEIAKKFPDCEIIQS